MSRVNQVHRPIFGRLVAPEMGAEMTRETNRGLSTGVLRDFYGRIVWRPSPLLSSIENSRMWAEIADRKALR